MAVFDSISSYYDNIITERKIDSFYLDLYREFNAKSAYVLDLGCGTGVFLSKIRAAYKKGIDASSGMVLEAKVKNPDASFEIKKIQDVVLPMNTFDFIVSMYDVINIIPTFEDWKDLFQKIAFSLKEKGIFAFDINDKTRQEYLSSISPMVKKFAENYSITTVKKIEKEYYKWENIIFFQKNSDIYTLKKMVNIEFSPEINLIKGELERYFTSVEIIEIESLLGKSTKGKKYFICRKK